MYPILPPTNIPKIAHIRNLSINSEVIKVFEKFNFMI